MIVADLPAAELSPAERLAIAPPEHRAAVLESLTTAEVADLAYEWEFWARPDQVPPTSRWSLWALIAGRGAGKMLDLDTLIPTPLGWRELRSVALGDEVFDEQGQPCRVTGVHDGWPERAWCLRFSDHSSLIAGGEHQWVTWTTVDRKAWNRTVGRTGPLPPDWPIWRGQARWGQPSGSGPTCRSTDQIVATLATGPRGDRNHSIPTTAPLRMPETTLAVDPYVLGLWLGDGSSAEASITMGAVDADEILAQVRARGYRVAQPRTKIGATCSTWPIGGAPLQRDPLTGRMMPNGGLHSSLRLMGVLKAKHAPENYLWAAEGQRLDLLRGLMDSDGCATSHHTVEFISTNRRLADAVVFLARSLGERPVIAKGRATLYGVDCGPKWRVTWAPARHNPFTLRRKADAVVEPGTQGSRRFHRMIVGADAVAVRPMRCLEVDSPHHLYLAGEAMIPTHNTRSGSEWTRKRGPQGKEGLLVGANPRDVRDFMLEGRSGILTISPDGERPIYESSKLLLTWPNGATAHVRSAEDPESIRGVSADWCWCDELAKWRKLQETWDQIRFALREGEHPQTVVTTTPKPLQLVQHMIAGKGFPNRVLAPRVSTFRNAGNLAPDFLAEMTEVYEGTRLGRQELHAELLADIEGALWNWAMIEAARYAGPLTENDHGLAIPDPPPRRIVVAVDPTGSKHGDECGIVVCGADPGRPPVGFVLEDRSLQTSPAKWAEVAVDAYYRWEAEAIVAERNYGAEMVELTVRTVPATTWRPGGESVRFQEVTASKGKEIRAEPVVGFYEQNLRGVRRVQHVGNFIALETQMTAHVPGARRSDGQHWDRVDALVWGMTYLLLTHAWKPATSGAATLLAGSIPT